ncbi:DUF3611 family protein [Phormidesmis priestleyi]|uniref:DUF3611 family protein n=1 Tax=Phormidesmis priestleyi TaxID=268141 RepID=UPI0039E17956
MVGRDRGFGRVGSHDFGRRSPTRGLAVEVDYLASRGCYLRSESDFRSVDVLVAMANMNGIAGHFVATVAALGLTSWLDRA